jgi:hypothetical protein
MPSCRNPSPSHIFYDLSCSGFSRTGRRSSWSFGSGQLSACLPKRLSGTRECPCGSCDFEASDTRGLFPDFSPTTSNACYPQEAHRHVFIERFGLLCLLKLRHKDTFGRRPNACWRLLYTLTLFPWLRKYRVGFLLNDDDEDKNDDIKDTLASSTTQSSTQLTKPMPAASMRSSGDSTGLLQEIVALKSRNRQLEAALADLQGQRDVARRGSSRRTTSKNETWEDEHLAAPAAPTSGVPTDAELSRIGWAKALDTRRNKWYYYNGHQKQWNNPLE